MYKITEDNISIFIQAFNLLNEIEVKGIQNVNALGNSSTLFKRFFDSLEKCEEEIPKQEEVEK